jgi:hypothetical protein
MDFVAVVDVGIATSKQELASPFSKHILPRKMLERWTRFAFET